MGTPSENAQERVNRVHRALQASGVGPGETLAVTTPDGREVHIESFSVTDTSVEIRLSGAAGGDPHFVIVNPPTLIPDPLGDVIVNGMRFREDPLRALAQAIADNGGAAPIRKGRRGR